MHAFATAMQAFAVSRPCQTLTQSVSGVSASPFRLRPTPSILGIHERRASMARTKARSEQTKSNDGAHLAKPHHTIVGFEARGGFLLTPTSSLRRWLVRELALGTS